MMEATYDMSAVDQRTSIFAGFWQRVVAHIIDWMLVSVAVCSFFILLAAAAPRVSQYIEVRMPFDALEVAKTLDEKTSTMRSNSGERVETTVTVYQILSPITPTYTYREISARRIAADGRRLNTATSTEMIDPTTRLSLDMPSVRSLIIPLLLLFAALFEASRLQASPGKLALGLKVASEQGNRLTFIRALVRNLLKILSVITVFIGFMMVAWTNRKQGLHDLIAGAVVLKPQT